MILIQKKIVLWKELNFCQQIHLHLQVCKILDKMLYELNIILWSLSPFYANCHHYFQVPRKRILFDKLLNSLSNKFVSNIAYALKSPWNVFSPFRNRVSFYSNANLQTNVLIISGINKFVFHLEQLPFRPVLRPHFITEFSFNSMLIIYKQTY